VAGCVTNALHEGALFRQIGNRDSRSQRAEKTNMNTAILITVNIRQGPLHAVLSAFQASSTLPVLISIDVPTLGKDACQRMSAAAWRSSGNHFWSILFRGIRDSLVVVA